MLASATFEQNAEQPNAEVRLVSGYLEADTRVMMVAVLRESEQEAKRGPKMSLKMSRGTPPREQIICSLHSHAGYGARACLGACLRARPGSCLPSVGSMTIFFAMGILRAAIGYDKLTGEVTARAGRGAPRFR